MHQQKFNIASAQEKLPQLMDLVVRGDEIIITKSNIPIAKISPIEISKSTFSADFLKAKSIEAKRTHFSDAPENWFG